MDILKLIETDHRQIKHLFRELERAGAEPGPEATALTAELVTETLLHARAADRVLYRACRDEGKKLQRYAMESHVRHKLIEIALKRLSTVEPGPDGEFLALVRVAGELFTRHGKEERAAMSRLKKLFNKAERKEMGERMIARKDQLREQQDGATRAPAIEPAPELASAVPLNVVDSAPHPEAKLPSEEANVPSGNVPAKPAGAPSGTAPRSAGLRPEPSSSAAIPSEELREAV